MNFSEALTVRLSHDLAGGIGAISSTVELMDLDPSFASDAAKMLHDSSRMLMARLRFYRALFGAETKSIDSDLVNQYLKTLAQKIDFCGEIHTRLELSLVAVGLILATPNSKIEYSNNTLTIQNKNLIIKENYKKILSGILPSESNPETVEAEWLIYVLQINKKQLSLSQNDTRIILKIS